MATPSLAQRVLPSEEEGRLVVLGVGLRHGCPNVGNEPFRPSGG